MMPGDEGSITRWIGGLKAGDEAAAQQLWERYFARIVGLARDKLRAGHRGDMGSDEEDAALSAFDSFCTGAARGQFPELADRDDLWRLLALITARKVFAQARRSQRLKRGGGLVRNASDLPGGEDSEEDDVLARAVGSEPTPEAAAVMAEEYRRLLDALDDETLKKVAVWRMEGYTEDAIAARGGCARRTVARQLALIRTIWRDAGF
jgi:DNA-directed RNA polymerase specialized sigma24 family protein